jgi:hypothetical protein
LYEKLVTHNEPKAKVMPVAASPGGVVRNRSTVPVAVSMREMVVSLDR